MPVSREARLAKTFISEPAASAKLFWLEAIPMTGAPVPAHDAKLAISGKTA